MALVLCPRCQIALPLADGGGQAQSCTCKGCRGKVRTSLFPALLSQGKTAAPPLPEAPPQEGEATCFYNPARRATGECGHCGVLISSLWAAQWGSGTVCLKCLDHLRSAQKDSRFEGKRTMWDNVTLGLALMPFSLVLYFTAFITAPAAVILGLWHWKKPRSMVPRGPWRMVVGLLLALAQVVAMGVGVVALYLDITNRP
jgi:hypothetical protein